MKLKIRTSLENKSESDYNEADRFHVAQKAYWQQGHYIFLSDVAEKMSNIDRVILDGVAHKTYGKKPK